MKMRNFGAIFVVYYLLVSLAGRRTAGEVDSTHSIRGAIIPPKGSTSSLELPKDTQVLLFTAGKSERRRAFPMKMTGVFSFEHVEDGIHMLDVDATGYEYPTIQIEKKEGKIIARVADLAGNPEISHPFRIPAIRSTAYYDIKQGFSIIGFLKTPYGIMIGFAVFSLVVLPMMKMDPEEYRQMMAEKNK